MSAVDPGQPAMFNRTHYREAAEFIRARTAHRPRTGLILGSGLQALADEVAHADRIPYAEIPHFPQPGVSGHSGQLVIGELGGQSILMMQGRAHPYEGHSLQHATLPVRVMGELGIETLVVTNAAGGLNPAFHAGDLMLIVDHIGLMAMTGGNPLWGPNDDTLGPRFPALNKAYDPALRRLALDVAAGLGIELRTGVYVGLGGPTYETPAEVRFLRLIGGDACGMSTVPEVIVARHMGLRVLGISGIANMATADPEATEEATHAEVLAAGKVMAPKMAAIVRGVLEGLSQQNQMTLAGV